MAQTTGLVQSLSVSTSQACCVQIGPDPSNAELLVISVTNADDAAVTASKISMIELLAAALASRRAVVANHGDQDATITQLAINPG